MDRSHSRMLTARELPKLPCKDITMSTAPATPLRKSLLRYSQRDAMLVALAFLHGAVLATRPPAAIVALGMWWCANTAAHHFIHTPFFRQAWLNRLMALYLSVAHTA